MTTAAAVLLRVEQLACIEREALETPCGRPLLRHLCLERATAVPSTRVLAPAWPLGNVPSSNVCFRRTAREPRARLQRLSLTGTASSAVYRLERTHQRHAGPSRCPHIRRE